MSVDEGLPRPVGVFGKVGELRREDLIDAVGGLVVDADPVIGYLRSGAVVIASMGYTRDLIADAFGVSGGSGIRTDGTYYWRSDAAEYVERYGVALPQDFIEHMRSLEWRCPKLTAERFLEIDRQLMAMHRPTTERTQR